MAELRTGYTLPVFACAAAIAALHHLRQDSRSLKTVSVDLLHPPQLAEIPIEQVARLTPDMSLAIARSDPGDHLDLTRNTPIWALVEWGQPDQTQGVQVEGGEGIGRQVNANEQPAIYAYAQQLLQTNLKKLLAAGEKIKVTIILPEGRALAERTSNAAFGVVDGLSLLGTHGIVEPSSAPGQLENYREALQHKANQRDRLVFCVGENGLDLASNLGIDPTCMIKTANWLGPLLVEAALVGVRSILLFGYHGKLIKLAGGIFHTHHHVADGRQEIFTAHCANLGLPTATLQTVMACSTVEAALNHLRTLDAETGSTWTAQVYQAIANQIDQRSQRYIQAHSEQLIQVGSILFDRDRKILVKSEIAAALLPKVLLI